MMLNIKNYEYICYIYNNLQLITKAFEHDDNLTKLSPKSLNIILQILGALENAIDQTKRPQKASRRKQAAENKPQKAENKQLL